MRLEQQVFEVLPAGSYRATVEEITEHDGQWGPYAKFTFRIDEPECQGVHVTAAASARFSNRSKLYRWTHAILGGQPIPRTYDFDSKDLIGRPCILVLEVVKDRDDAEFNRVQSIAPARKAKPAQAKAEPWSDASPSDLTAEPLPEEVGAMADFPF